jgi:hypothetical protein
MKRTNTMDTDSPPTFSLPWIPTCVRVSGLPFSWQGWNTIYHGKMRAGEVVYEMDPYTLYFFIPIASVSIRKLGKKWVLMRRDGCVICKKLDAVDEDDDDNQETPFGNWEYGMTVTGYTSI